VIRWPVFIPWFQHGDSGRPFTTGQTVEWPVVFVGGEAWPDEMTTRQSVRLSASGPGAAVAESGAMRASWRDVLRSDIEVEIRGLLIVDYLKPPFVYSRGQVERIRLVSQRQRVNSDGAIEGTWEGWQATDLEASVPRFRSRPGVDHMSETGLLVTLAM
jgi:hypothetical protein